APAEEAVDLVMEEAELPGQLDFFKGLMAFDEEIDVKQEGCPFELRREYARQDCVLRDVSMPDDGLDVHRRPGEVTRWRRGKLSLRDGRLDARALANELRCAPARQC